MIHTAPRIHILDNSVSGDVMRSVHHLSENFRRNHLPLIRATSLFFSEKLWLILDYMQIYGLLWTAAQPYPWPYLWLQWTRVIIYSNADYFGLTDDGAIMGRTESLLVNKWGQMSGYLNYALYFSLAPLVIGTFPFLLWPYLNSYGKRLDVYKAPILRWVLFLLQIVYMPSGLALVRLYYCQTPLLDPNSETLYLSADPDVVCASIEHIYITVICSICLFPLLIGLPIFLHKLITPSIVYRLKADHEKRLQLWELLYMLNLDNFWSDSQLWLSSSFKRDGVYFHVYMLIYKLSLLIIFISIRTNLPLQASLLWFATAVFLVWIGKDRPFRLKSTNSIFFTCNVLLLIDTSAAGANAFNVQNSVLVASTESVWLLVIHVVAMCYMAWIIIISMINPFESWPVNRTINRIEHNNSSLERILVWIELIREAHIIKLHSKFTCMEVMDYYQLEDVIQRLRRAWLNARSYGSLFETPLSESLEELLMLHSDLSDSSAALRKTTCWDDACIEYGELMSIRQRQREFIPHKKRSILLKCLAVRAFLGYRKKHSADDEEGGERSISDSFDGYTQSLGGYNNNTNRELNTNNLTRMSSNSSMFSYTYGDLENNLENRTRFTTEEIAEIKDEVNNISEVSEDLLRRNINEFTNENFIEIVLELASRWENIINTLKKGDLPGAHLYKPAEIEDWYIYRKSINKLIEKLQMEGFIEPIVEPIDVEEEVDDVEDEDEDAFEYSENDDLNNAVDIVEDELPSTSRDVEVAKESIIDSSSRKLFEDLESILKQSDDDDDDDENDDGNGHDARGDNYNNVNSEKNNKLIENHEAKTEVKNDESGSGSGQGQGSGSNGNRVGPTGSNGSGSVRDTLSLPVVVTITTTNTNTNTTTTTTTTTTNTTNMTTSASNSTARTTTTTTTVTAPALEKSRIPPVTVPVTVTVIEHSSSSSEMKIHNEVEVQDNENKDDNDDDDDDVVADDEIESLSDRHYSNDDDDNDSYNLNVDVDVDVNVNVNVNGNENDTSINLMNETDITDITDDDQNNNSHILSHILTSNPITNSSNDNSNNILNDSWFGAAAIHNHNNNTTTTSTSRNISDSDSDGGNNDNRNNTTSTTTATTNNINESMIANSQRLQDIFSPIDNNSSRSHNPSGMFSPSPRSERDGNGNLILIRDDDHITL